MSLSPADSRAAWLEERRHGVGASDVAGLLGLSPWASPFSIFADKVYGLDDDRETLAMSFGRRAEPMISPWFTELTGLYIGGEQESCVHPEHAHHRCTIDGRVFDGFVRDKVKGCFDLDAALGVLEIKTTSATPTEWEEEGIPVYYQAQAQWSMHVTGSDHLWFSTLHLAFGRPDLRVYELHRDEADVELITSAVDAFWADHVLAGIPPDTDAHPATTYATKHLPASAGAVTEVTADVAEWVAALASHKADRKTLDGFIDEAENAIRAALGEATEGHFNGELVVSHRPQRRSGIDTAALKARLPRVAAKFATESTYRVLRHHKPSKPKGNKT